MPQRPGHRIAPPSRPARAASATRPVPNRTHPPFGAVVIPPVDRDSDTYTQLEMPHA
jgi:hypothetical protein